MQRTRAAMICVAVLAAVVASASGAGAQTTTVPPVRSIPVTPAAPTAPPTTAPRPAGTSDTAASQGAPLADTGVAADKLVPLGLLLVGLGGALQAGARRPRRSYGLL